MHKKGQRNKVYLPEFKIMVVEAMRKECLSYHETVRRFGMDDANTGSNRATLRRWERIYLEEGVEGLIADL